MENQDTEQPISKKSQGGFFSLLKEFFRYIRFTLTLRDTDSQLTIANLTQAVEFKGVNVWVLFFAIIIASVGLNVNSTAVIIGAMLISPLMGPIMGVGLSISINDYMLLRKSFKNLLVMVLISLCASSFYFLISPLSDAQSELLARTQPTIYDVFIAFFGGMAGIIASSRRQEKITVVSGVAIATALMPPLCTAGYGLGTAQWHYFFGAIYLFFINSFFIALATYLMTRYFQFPRKTYLNSAKEKRVRQIIFVLSIVALLPSIFTAVNVVRESSFNSQSIKFVAAIEKNSIFDNVQVVDTKREYDRKQRSIILTLIGKPLSAEQLKVMKDYLAQYDLSDVKLEIRQAGAATLDIDAQAKMLQRYIEEKERQIEKRDSSIVLLKHKIEKERMKRRVSSQQLAKEVSVLYPSILSLSVGYMEQVNTKTLAIDSIPSLTLQWKTLPDEKVENTIEEWLKLRMGVRQVHVQHQKEKK